MSNIEKAAQVIAESKGFQSALPFGTPEQVQERHAGLIAQALTDAGLIVLKGTSTEWGVRFSEQYIDAAPSEQAAREKASYIGRPVMRRTVTSAVTEWEVAP